MLNFYYHPQTDEIEIAGADKSGKYCKNFKVQSKWTSRKTLSDFQLSTNSLHQNDCYCRNNTNFAGQTNKFCKYLLVEIYDKNEIK